MDNESVTTTDEAPPLPTIAILAATLPEIAPTIRRLNLKRASPTSPYFVGENESVRAVAVVTGIGPTNAAAALIRLLDGEHIASIINVGFAGGLEHGLYSGDLLDVWWLMNADGALLRITDRIPVPITEAPERTPQRTLLTVDHLVTTISEKRKLYSRHAAASVDMESFQLAKLASQLNVPFRVVRAVCDPADMAIPREVQSWVKPDGRPDVRAVLRDLWRHPSWLPFIMRLRKITNLAAETLARKTVEVFQQESGHLSRGAAAKEERRDER